MSKKKGFLGALVIGAVAAISLLGLFVVSPSCAGAVPDVGPDDAALVAPPPAIDPRAEALEATAQAAVAATVAAATAFTAADIEATVEAVLVTRESESTMEPDQRSRVWGGGGPATVTPPPLAAVEPSATPEVTQAAPRLIPEVTPFGPAPVFADDWAGVYGSLDYCPVPEDGFGIPCIGDWIRVVDDYSVSYVEPEGAAWLSVGWIDAGMDVDVDTRLADLPDEAVWWPVYEFWGRSEVTSLAGYPGVRLDYGRQALALLCAERVSEVWYEVGERVYQVTFGYCRDDWEAVGGYQDVVVLGITFDDP